jgi:alpha-tubulin suppressor-like RCC1 family protein
VVGGAVRCWGDNAQGQLGTATTADTSTTPIAAGMTLVAAGENQTCAATGTSNGTNLDDSVQCWGDSVGAAYLLAVPQRTPAIPLRSTNRSTIQYPVEMMAAGAHHLCVRNKNEAVECLGANDAGQLGGVPLEAGVTVPVGLPAVALPIVQALAAGDAHSCAALADGRIRCWGSNASGQLGDGTTTTPAVAVLVNPSGE